MDIPAGWAKVYDSDGGPVPAGMDASSGASFSLPAGRHRYAWPIEEVDPRAASPAPLGTGGAAQTLQVSVPREHPDDPLPPGIAELFSECIIEAEFSGLQPGSNVILEFAECYRELPETSGSDFSREPKRRFIVLEYRADGYWCIGESTIGWI